MINLAFDVVTSLNSNGVDTMLKIMKESDYDYQLDVSAVVANGDKATGYESVIVTCNSYTSAVHLVADYLDIKSTLVTPEDVDSYLVQFIFIHSFFIIFIMPIFTVDTYNQSRNYKVTETIQAVNQRDLKEQVEARGRQVGHIRKVR